MNQSYENFSRPENPALWNVGREPRLKLSLETRNRGGVVIVHCQGRIVYRDEANEFSRFVQSVLQESPKVIIDFSDVTSLDSAGIGGLVLLHMKTRSEGTNFKCVGLKPFLRNLLDLTNLDSVLEVHPSLEEALESFWEEQVCTDC